MAEIKVNTGVVSFSVNGKCEIAFNPTDSAFVEKLFRVFETLDQRQETYRKKIADRKSDREVFEIARSQDTEMREIIDGLFGPVCDELFGGMNVYAMADGLPVWCNFLLAVMDEIDTSFAQEQKKTNPRVAKYTAKYQKYQK